METVLAPSYVRQGALPLPAALRGVMPQPRQGVLVRTTDGADFSGKIHSSRQRIDQLHALMRHLALKGGERIGLSIAGPGTLLVAVVDRSGTRQIPVRNPRRDALRTRPRETTLQSFILTHLDSIEAGLQLFREQGHLHIGLGTADIVAVDNNAHIVVIEIKCGLAGDAASGQLLGYMSTVANVLRTNKVTSVKGVRGILIADGFNDRVVQIARAHDDVTLMKYELTGRGHSVELRRHQV